MTLDVCFHLNMKGLLIQSVLKVNMAFHGVLPKLMEMAIMYMDNGVNVDHIVEVSSQVHIFVLIFHKLSMLGYYCFILCMFL